MSDPVNSWIHYGRTKTSPTTYIDKDYPNIIFVVSPSDIKQKNGIHKSRARCDFCNKFIKIKSAFFHSVGGCVK